MASVYSDRRIYFLVWRHIWIYFVSKVIISKKLITVLIFFHDNTPFYIFVRSFSCTRTVSLDFIIIQSNYTDVTFNVARRLLDFPPGFSINPNLAKSRSFIYPYPVLPFWDLSCPVQFFKRYSVTVHNTLWHPSQWFHMSIGASKMTGNKIIYSTDS